MNNSKNSNSYLPNKRITDYISTPRFFAQDIFIIIIILFLFTNLMIKSD